MKAALGTFVILFAAVLIASLAWTIQLDLLLRSLRSRHPSVHARIVAPFRASWTAHFNPWAACRLFAFVFSGEGEDLSDARLTQSLRRLRATGVVSMAGFVILSGVLAAVFTMLPR